MPLFHLDSDNFCDVPLLAYKREPDLKNILVHSHLKHFLVPENVNA